MTRYLLPCSCGEKIPVGVPQAGETIRCGCGASLAVPTLRELRTLEPAEPDQPAVTRPAASWGVRQSLALLGLVIAVAALGFAGWLFTQRPPPLPGDPQPDFIRRETDKLGPVQAWRIWRSLRTRGLDEQKPRKDKARDEAWRRYFLATAATGLVALAGVGLCVGAILSGRRRSGRAPPG